MREDDWTMAADRNQKKRMQNRVAQRTYRNRIKQRVEELEKEVSEYRRRAQEQDNPLDELENRPNSNSTGSSNDHDRKGSRDTDEASNGMGHERDRDSICVNVNEGASSNESKTRHETNTHLDDGNEFAMEMDNTMLGDGQSNTTTPTYMPQQSTSQHQHQHQHHHQHQQAQVQLQNAAPTILPFTMGLLGMSQNQEQNYHSVSEWQWSNGSTIYRDTMVQPPSAPGLPTPLEMPGGQVPNGNSSNNDKTHNDGHNPSYQIPPDDGTYFIQPGSSHGHAVDAELDFRTPSEVPSSNACETDEPSPGCSMSGASLQMDAMREMRNSYAFSATTGSPDMERLAKEGCLEDKFDFLRQCLNSAGFSDFEAVFGQYYTAEFSYESVVSREQRRSRHSQLPQLMARLRQDAQTWPAWEAHGYQYEIIKSAESLVHAERSDFTLSTKICMDVLAELRKERLSATSADGSVSVSGVSTDGGGSTTPDIASMSRVFRPMTKLLQDKLPKLWAVVDSLVGCDDELSQRQRSYMSLAIMLLLCGPSQKSLMTEMVISCLHMAHADSR